MPAQRLFAQTLVVLRKHGKAAEAAELGRVRWGCVQELPEVAEALFVLKRAELATAGYSAVRIRAYSYAAGGTEAQSGQWQDGEIQQGQMNMTPTAARRAPRCRGGHAGGAAAPFP